MKRKKKGNKIDYKKFIMIFIMMFSLIIAMITYWIYAYNHKYNTYRDNLFVRYRLDDYVYVEGDLVYLKNIDDYINNSFINKQRNIINDGNSYTEISKNVVKDILSIRINYFLTSKKVKTLTFNYDLKNKKVIDNDYLLNKYDISYNDIAIDIFNNYVRLDGNGNIVDAISDKELTYVEFNNNSEKYIIRIREKLPEIINLYVDNEGIYYSVDLTSIYSVCYKTDKGNYINKKIGGGI